MASSGIEWPSEPYAFETRVDPRSDLRRAIHGKLRIVTVSLVVTNLIVLVALAASESGRQSLADLAVSHGYGRTIPDAVVVEPLSCLDRPYARELARDCRVRIRSPQLDHEYDMLVSRGLPLEPGRIAMLDMRVAVAWPREVIWNRLGELLFFLALLPGMVLLSIATFWATRGPSRASARGAHIIDADLLRRKQWTYGWAWDFGYDFDGKRRYARTNVTSNPIVTDGVVTQGAAIVSAKGHARLLTVSEEPLVLEPGARNALADAIQSRFNGYRPPLQPGFAEFVATIPAGPARDFADAFGRTWQGTTIEEINAAVLDRHNAAARLEPKEVDRLLADCRRFVAGFYGEG